MPLSHGLLSFRHFTRLISIVSKPMLIVVVVVVIVVFVKKMLGPKKFSEFSHHPKMDDFPCILG